jgi:hypothetical protein
MKNNDSFKSGINAQILHFIIHPHLFEIFAFLQMAAVASSFLFWQMTDHSV